MPVIGRHRRIAAGGLLLGLALVAAASAQQRFPPPEFDSGHELPAMTRPVPSMTTSEVVDLLVMVAALSLCAYLTLVRRSRHGIAWLTAFSLVYFGFYREGCICPIGSIQNVTLSLADPSYSVPLTVVLIFVVPLAFCLMFGRVFCGGVCPLGAIQDMVLVRAVKVPRWLDRALGLLPHTYLGLAVLYAATGSAFVICKYDPFVAVFRLSGGIGMLVLGAAVLALATFVGRPYCRYVCPYGVLLGALSRFAWRRPTITPSVCISCHLCDDSCPFGAVRLPAPQTSMEES